MHNYRKRISNLRTQLRQRRLPAILLTNRINILYLTGFTGSAGQLLVTPKNVQLLTDSRYETQVASQCPDLDVAIRSTGEQLVDLTKKVIGKAKLRELGYESSSLTKAQFDQLESAIPKVTLVETGDAVESLRAIKDKTEIAAIRKSIRVNERTFEVIRASLTPAQTEREVAFNLEHQMRQFGATGCCFEPIVAVGPNAALPHATPGSNTIGERSMVLIDWGATVADYASDLTRMLVMGKPTDKFRKIYDTVLAAQQAGIDAIRPGAIFGEVDRAARKVIDDAGFGKRFGHSLGHGFGLEVHEFPGLAPNREGELKAGMVVTVEPGIYLPNWGGIRIEDDILVTPDGHEVLSRLPKELDACIVHV